MPEAKMLSHKILRIEKFLELAISGQVYPPTAALRAALVAAKSAREDAVQLEQKVVPRRQRLDASHLQGNVTIFPVVAAPEAQL
jgi:hypothetical protein